MLVSQQNWQNLGRILSPRSDVEWLTTCTGASCVRQLVDSEFEVFVAGRDSQNRSLIGTVTIDLRSPNEILRISEKPVIELGELGAFDENGVSYPCLVESGGESNSENTLFLYYTGWMPSVRTPFQNHLGLATSTNGGEFERISRAPILPRTNDDPFCIGSAFVLKEAVEEAGVDMWKMWYTSFQRWGSSPDDPKHHYHIKYAESKDGIHWDRPNQICIDFANESEYAIARPSVLKVGNQYHMWYCYRGAQYRIGYATSANGKNWTRRDDLVSLQLSDWDNESQAYPHVFEWNQRLFMLYCGNDYGKQGLGLAELPYDAI